MGRLPRVCSHMAAVNPVGAAALRRIRPLALPTLQVLEHTAVRARRVATMCCLVGP